jgi:hypothetical protein
MNVNRRNVLLGLGTAAAGSGAVFGSGAFTQVEAERSLSVTVDKDSAASVALKAGDAADGEIASISNNNELTFDLGGTTLNSSSDLVIGDTSISAVSDATSEVAFLIEDSGDLTDSSDTSLGVNVSVDASGAPAEAGVQFIGDSDINDLGNDTNSDEDQGSIDTSSGSIDDIAGSSSFSGDQFDRSGDTDKAQFVLNTASGSRSSLAGGILIIETDSVSGDTQGTIDLSITAGAVGDSTLLGGGS